MRFSLMGVRVAVLAAALVISGQAMADYTRYFEDDEQTSYLDRNSITRAGSEARMWTIDNYRKPQTDLPGKTFVSVKAHWVYDCAKRMSDVLVAFYHAAPMAEGQEVHAAARGANRQWDTVDAGSVGELAFNVACDVKPPAPAPAPNK
jgi:hypothetical protein